MKTVTHGVAFCYSTGKSLPTWTYFVLCCWLSIAVTWPYLPSGGRHVMGATLRKLSPGWCPGFHKWMLALLSVPAILARSICALIFLPRTLAELLHRVRSSSAPGSAVLESVWSQGTFDITITQPGSRNANPCTGESRQWKMPPVHKFLDSFD